MKLMTAVPQRILPGNPPRASRIFFSALFIASCGVLPACGGGGGDTAPIAIGSLTITPAAPTVVIKETTKLSVVVKATSGEVLTDRAVHWTSASPAIATVTDSGIVTGVAIGSAVLTASSGGVTATVTAVVKEDPCDVKLATPILANVLTNGTLASTDCVFKEDGTLVDAYSLVLPLATTLQIVMRSTAFDAYLFVVSIETDGRATLLGEDDDSAGGNDARLFGSLTAGTYYILANNINVGGLGAYTLLVTSPYSEIRAGESMFGTPFNSGVTLRRLGAAEARTIRGLVRSKQ